MQIHELNNFAGTPTSSDYLAIDNSTTTTKIGATGLGVQDKLTVAEANTGTSTASRIVTPKVVHDYVVQDSTHVASATTTKWANITGGDGSIDNAMGFQADIFGGAVYSDSGSESFVTGSSTRRIKILKTLTAGTWLVFATVGFSQSSTGKRAIAIYDADGNSYGRQTTTALSNLNTTLSTSCIIKYTSSADVELHGYQDSGSTLTATWSYQIIRLQ